MPPEAKSLPSNELLKKVSTSNIESTDEGRSIIFDDREYEEVGFNLNSQDLNRFGSETVSIKRSRVPWSDEEMEFLRRGVLTFGNSWSSILESYDFAPLTTPNYLRNIARRMRLIKNDHETIDEAQAFSMKEEDHKEINDKHRKPSDFSSALNDGSSSNTDRLQYIVNRRIPWSEEEVRNLREGFSLYGRNWVLIRSKFAFHVKRTNVDLKDKARQLNLC
jgi:hypothetical protein